MLHLLTAHVLMSVDLYVEADDILSAAKQAESMCLELDPSDFHWDDITVTNVDGNAIPY